MNKLRLKKIYKFISGLILIIGMNAKADVAKKYECKTKDTASVIKYTNGNTILLVINNNHLSINSHYKVWNYLTLDKKSEHLLFFTSINPENFLQNSDLVAILPEETSTNSLEFDLTNTTSNLISHYSCNEK